MWNQNPNLPFFDLNHSPILPLTSLFLLILSKTDSNDYISVCLESIYAYNKGWNIGPVSGRTSSGSLTEYIILFSVAKINLRMGIIC